MHKAVYQLRDKTGLSLGGHVFVAPNEEALNASIEGTRCDGVVMTVVGSESEIEPVDASLISGVA